MGKISKFRHWINKNYKNIIITAFLFPIITVALVSISHVTQWYEISNMPGWAIYLSVGVEIAAMSALAAIAARMGRKAYFPFIIVTLIQFIGNIFFSYDFIDVTSKSFQSWVELVSPLLQLTGVDATNVLAHKRFLAFLAGGLLPIISLSFLHMLVRFTEEDRMRDIQRGDDAPEEEPLPEVANNTQLQNEWKESEELKDLTPMPEDSPIIDLVKPNEQQVIKEDNDLVPVEDVYLLDGKLVYKETPIPEPIVHTIPEPTPTIAQEVKEIEIPREVIEEATRLHLSDEQIKEIELFLLSKKPAEPENVEPSSDEIGSETDEILNYESPIIQEEHQEPNTPDLSDNELISLYDDEINKVENSDKEYWDDVDYDYGDGGEDDYIDDLVETPSDILPTPEITSTPESEDEIKKKA